MASSIEVGDVVRLAGSPEPRMTVVHLAGDAATVAWFVMHDHREMTFPVASLRVLGGAVAFLPGTEGGYEAGSP